MKKLNIAVVGVGNISRSHIAGYQALPNVELYALCDVNEERLKQKGEMYGITRLYTDEATMLRECPEIDAVSVCTWNSEHAKASILAMNAGKHVLCEKPMAMNPDEAQEMIETSKRNRVKLMVGFVRRFGNDTKVIKDFVAGGSVGDIYYAKASYLRRCGCPGGWFGDKSRSGGGPLIDLGVHVIDLARYLMGRPAPVSVSGATFHNIGNRAELHDKPAYRSASATDHDIYDVEDLATAMIRFENGAVLTIDASFNLNIKNDVGSLELFGTKGGIRLTPEVELYTEMNHYLADVSLKMKTAFDFAGAFKAETRYFVDAITNDTDVSEIAEDGCTLMKILDAIYRSAATGKEVRL